ncbi:hypothetical protein AAF695_02595 [Aerococcus viridans]
MNNKLDKNVVDMFYEMSIRASQDLVIVTGSGTIIGSPLDFDILEKFFDESLDYENENYDSSHEYPISSMVKLYNHMNDDSRMSDSGIWLKDVIIKGSNTLGSINMPIIFVLYDHIAALSLGELRN